MTKMMWYAVDDGVTINSGNETIYKAQGYLYEHRPQLHLKTLSLQAKGGHTTYQTFRLYRVAHPGERFWKVTPEQARSLGLPDMTWESGPVAVQIDSSIVPWSGFNRQILVLTK